MILRLLLLFTVIPIVELAILIRIGQAVGAGPTIVMVILVGLLGAWLARRQGLRTITAIQDELRAGRLPGDQIIDAMLVFAAGVLLVTPGVLTDVLGIALLTPLLRRLIRNALKRRFQSRFVVFHPRQDPRDDFIDVEASSAHTRDSQAPPLP